MKERDKRRRREILEAARLRMRRKRKEEDERKGITRMRVEKGPGKVRWGVGGKKRMSLGELVNWNEGRNLGR